MDDPAIPSDLLEGAVELASDWIRARRYSAGKAVVQATRRYGVDRHLVAQRLGSRGGHRAAALRRMAPADLPIELVALRVEEIAPIDSATVKVLAYPMSGPLVSILSEFPFSSTWPPPVAPGDAIVCRVRYCRDSRCRRYLQLVECIEIVRGGL